MHIMIAMLPISAHLLKRVHFLDYDQIKECEQYFNDVKLSKMQLSDYGVKCYFGVLGPKWSFLASFRTPRITYHTQEHVIA